MMDADGTNVTRVTTDPASDVAPAWSPDGTMLVFQSSRVSPAELYVTSRIWDGLSTRLTTRPDAGAVSPDWQPLAGPKGNVTVILELVDSDGFRFDLYVGAQVVLAAAGDGGSGTTTVAPGSYSLGPDPGPQNTLSNYVGSTSCTKDGNPYIANAEHGASVDVAAGDHVVCTIRLVRIGHTATGANVVVTPVDATTGSSPVRITFGTVTFAGVTTLQTSNTGPPAPSGFEVAGSYYELSTTAAFDEAEVCFEIVPPSAPTIAHWTGDPPAVSTPATYYRDAAGAIVPAPTASSPAPSSPRSPRSRCSCRPPRRTRSRRRSPARRRTAPGTARTSRSTAPPRTTAPASPIRPMRRSRSPRRCRPTARTVTRRPGRARSATAPGTAPPPARSPATRSTAGRRRSRCRPTRPSTRPRPPGATVSYDASASDGADPSPGVSCTHVSGSVVRDRNDSRSPARRPTTSATAATGAFTVTVLGAKQQLARLIGNVVTASRLPRHVKAQLLAKLEPLVAAFDPSDPAQRRKACCRAGHVQDRRCGCSPATASRPAQATAWIADANRIRAVIGC